MLKLSRNKLFLIPQLFSVRVMGSASSNGVSELVDRALDEVADENMSMKATLGAGCYWGTENYVTNKWGKQNGCVIESAVGFMGGKTANPSYEDVCTGQTGHVEVLDVQLEDVSGVGKAAVYEDLIRYFFQFHDPTTLNRQGNDHGTQYASVIFVYDEAQRRIATKVRDELNEHLLAGRITGYSGDTVTTAIVAASDFYKAPSNHQDYLTVNPGGYCNHRIRFKAWPALK
jgi:peptide-methionine (S)-S-oxide reductase